MSDRIHSLTVVLSHDIQDDDVEHITNAIGMIRNVIRVVPLVADPMTHMAEARAQRGVDRLLLGLVRAEPETLAKVQALLDA